MGKEVEYVEIMLGKYNELVSAQRECFELKERVEMLERMLNGYTGNRGGEGLYADLFLLLMQYTDEKLRNKLNNKVAGLE